MFIEFWNRFEPQIRPTRLEIKFLLITARVEEKVRLCVKQFDFFCGWILIRFTWNLSRFVLNSVEILTWNFRKKLFRENVLEILCRLRLSSTKTCEILPYIRQFLFLIRIALKKIHTSTFICCLHPGKEARPQKITKRRYAEEKPGRSVFGKQVLFSLGLGLTTPYSLGVLVWNFYQTFETVSIEFWVRFEPHIRPTRLTINILLITARVDGKVLLCVKLFDFFREWILIRLTWNLSRFVLNSVEIWYDSNKKIEMILWHFMESTWVGDWIGTFIEMDQCSMFQELTKTCTITPKLTWKSISCQLNRLNCLRM